MAVNELEAFLTSWERDEVLGRLQGANPFGRCHRDKVVE